jgi:Papain-like cysteine protease AvrRpt2
MMPTRRTFLAGGALCLAFGARPSWARLSCRPVEGSTEVCRAEIDFQDFLQHAYDPQRASQWCWAACISMVFAFHGHPIRQERIVEEAYGGLYDLPSGSGRNIARQLDRSWVDDRGRPFRSRLLSLFDAHDGRQDMDNAAVVEGLSRGQPIIVGARDHTVVLTAVDYLPSPAGFRLLGAGVFDPWPGIGPRDLAADEMVPVAEGGSLGFVALPEID